MSAPKLWDYLKYWCPKDLAHWQSLKIRGISRDGRTVVGYGVNEDGKTEAWIAGIGDVKKPISELMPKKGKKPEPADDGV